MEYGVKSLTTTMNDTNEMDPPLACSDSVLNALLRNDDTAIDVMVGCKSQPPEPVYNGGLSSHLMASDIRIPLDTPST